jgi:hypothetical protein
MSLLNSPTQDAQGGPRGLFRACTSCGSDVHIKSKTCRHCGGPSPWATGRKEIPAPDEDTVLDLTQPLGLDPTIPPLPGDRVAKPEASPESEEPREPYRTPAPFIPQPHVFIRDFVGTLPGGYTVDMKKDRVITDWMTISKLLEIQAPIEPVGKHGDMACCPNCRTIFKFKPVDPAMPAPTRRR